MAIYHLHVQPISRSSGRSAIAAAAYRSGDCLENERDGIKHDYTQRHGVVHSEIVLPENRQFDWAQDRSRLWNAAEAAERRKDACVAREIEVSLPHELDAAQRQVLARDFAQALADRYGVAVDLAIHSPHGDTDARNHHVHLLLTTRTVNATGLGQKSQLEWENQRLKALGLPTAPAQLQAIRQEWADLANHHLARAGLALQIDARSHAARGLALAPTRHMGVHATALARRGEAVSRTRLEPKVAQANAWLLRTQPEQVLALITAEKSVFDRHDIARALHRAVPPEESPMTFQLALERVMAAPELVTLQAEVRDAYGGVRVPARYTTQAMLALEHEMAACAERLAAAQGFAVAPRRLAAALGPILSPMRGPVVGPSEGKEGALAQPAPARGAGRPGRRQWGQARGQSRAQLARGAAGLSAGLSEEQRAAVTHLAGPQRLAAVVGLAGAGKSTMLAAARQAWEAEGYRVHGAALAGKAAEGLQASAGIAARTLASWERSWAKGFDALGSRDVLVLDEAGMVASPQLARVVSTVERSGAKLVLVGDPEQLQPIGPGAAFRAVAERVGCVELEGVRRQREDWQRQASIDFGRHRTTAGLAAYAEHGAEYGAVRLEADTEAARAAIVAAVLRDRADHPEASQLVLAHRRADVRALNEAIRMAIRTEQQEKGELAEERVYATTEGARAFAPGDRLLFRENDRALGVKNGMLGTVTAVEDGQLAVRLDGEGGTGREPTSRTVSIVSIVLKDYAAIDHGYATTIHKAQGATVDRAYVLASASMDRHLTYVAMTRHRDSVQLVAGREVFADTMALATRLARAQVKETSLDYAPERAAYAARHGVEASPVRAEALGVSPMLVDWAERWVDRWQELERARARLGPSVASLDEARASVQLEREMTAAVEALQRAPQLAGAVRARWAALELTAVDARDQRLAQVLRRPELGRDGMAHPTSRGLERDGPRGFGW